MRQKTLVWFLAVVRAVGSLLVLYGLYEVSGGEARPYAWTMLELSLVCLVIAPWSVRLPSGAAWRPGLPLLMMSLYMMPPTLTVLVPLPCLAYITAKSRSPWWKYVETSSHVGLGLFAGAEVYRHVDALWHPYLFGPLLATAAGLVTHLIVNRLISAVIVAHREGRNLRTQVIMTVHELHWGYMNSYLLVLMPSLIHPRYLIAAIPLTAAVQSGIFRAVTYYCKVAKLQESVWTDGLTNVSNRNAWESFVKSNRSDCVHGAIAVLDVNDFKLINDHFGHGVGDEVLRDLAQTISSRMPPTARLFRFGGDEFVLFVPKEFRATLHSQLHEAIGEMNHRWHSRGVASHVSIGIARLPEDSSNLSEAFLFADKRMYEEKRTHRLQVTGGVDIDIPPMIQGLIVALESRDRYTAGHSYRVAYYSFKLAERIGLESGLLEAVFRAGIVHDIGKVGVSDAILNKPNRLTALEMQAVRQHVDVGYEMCSKLGFSQDELDVILLHHERWNGSGYPRQLKEQEIPIVARITGLCDTYDALTSSRSYRSAWSHESAMQYIRDNAGDIFDPQCVEHWMDINAGQPLKDKYPRWIQQTSFAELTAHVRAAAMNG